MTTEDWRMVPLWSLVSETRVSVDPTELGDRVVHYSIPAIDATGTGQVEPTDSIKSAKLRLRGGEVLISKLNPRKSRAVIVEGSSLPIVSSTEFVGLIPGRNLEPRFLAYFLQSESTRQVLDSQVQSVTRSHQRVAPEDVTHLLMPVPTLEEQRRIVEFLDAETALIDRVRKARSAQSALLTLMVSQLVDGTTTGDAETLKKLGVNTDGSRWEQSKVSRLCQVIPGYAFPSEGFVQNGRTRLLRGINLSVDETSWDDGVFWDEERMPTPQRFHLGAGDLVLGMDRPWISTGMRMAFITDRDLPALLLQRVACLRPKSANVDMGYIYWSLRSSRFRRAVEGEMTGVSVPHLSGDQIGGFAFPLPPISVQREISDRLAARSASIRALRSVMDRQIELLNERRHALITAAVTGQFDVSTASGRNVTEGVAV